MVADIQGQLDEWAAARWTNAEIDARIDSRITSKLAGNVTIGGTLTAGGIDSTDLKSTSNRFVAWAGPDGKLGHM